ncbi:hypothetical protein ACFOGJ_08820 [Marinibaculum pumilum]|uniref:Phage tail tape measure protein n=1 Tax=Marinibaculum pumilum TaxID=1766165 RepID=A0ABV7KYE8_9PROT
MIVRELVARLGLDSDDAERQAKNFDRAIDDLKVGLLAVVGAATAAGAALFGVVSSTASYGDEVAKTADKLGIGIDALEQLRFAAERSGVAQNTLDMALQRMTRRLAEAAQGSGEAKDAVAELGLSAAALGRMAPEDALNEIADALSKVKNQSDRVRLAFKLFDSEGVGMVNLIGKGSEEVRKLRAEFELLSGGLTEDQARAAEAFDDSMTNIRTALHGLRLQLGAELLPVAVEWIDALKDWYLANREVVRQNLSRMLQGMVGALRSLWHTLRMIALAIHGVVEGTVGWERAFRLLASLLGAFAFMRIARGLWAIAAGLWGATFGAKGLRAALKAFPGAILLVLLGLAVEDLMAYFSGAPSVIGAAVAEIREILSDPESWGSQALRIATFVFDSIVRGAYMVRDGVAAAVAYIRDMLSDPDSWGRQAAAVAAFAFASIARGAGMVADTIGAAWDFIERVIVDGWAGAVAATNSAIDTFRRMRDSVVGWAEDIWQAVERIVSALGRLSGLGGIDLGGLTSPSSWFGAGAEAGPAQTVPITRPGAAVSVQIQEDVTVNVPAGTSQEQARAIDQQVRTAVAREWQREINAAMGDFPAYQGA